jgi:hypothetical protein
MLLGTSAEGCVTADRQFSPFLESAGGAPIPGVSPGSIRGGIPLHDRRAAYGFPKRTSGILHHGLSPGLPSPTHLIENPPACIAGRREHGGQIETSGTVPIIILGGTHSILIVRICR